MNRKKKFILLALILSVQSAGIVFASGNFQASSWGSEKTYVDKVTHKLGFGFLNILTGWTELFFEPCRSENSILMGIGKGLAYSITDTVGGVLHLGTFLIPVDIPLPNGGISHEYSI